MRGGHASGLAAGTYALTVSDTIGNTGSASYEVKTPEVLNASIKLISPAGTNQTDGKAAVEVSGGTAPYTYRWDTGASNQTATNLGGGIHYLTITDQNGCEVTDSILVQENILPLAVNVTQKNIDCYGSQSGQIQLDVTGGKAPFSFKWSDPTLEGEKLSDKRQLRCLLRLGNLPLRSLLALLPLQQLKIALLKSANHPLALRLDP